MGVFDLEATISLNTSEYKSQLRDAAGMTENAGRALDARTIAIGNILSDLAKKGGEFFVQQAQAGIQYNAQIEKYTTTLTTALGDEAKAAAAIEQIKLDAARTPYSVDGLVQANMYLIAAGESASDARKTILALGDAVSATGGSNAELQRMALNLQQVKNQGKAAGIDLKQFAQAGIAIWPVLTEYTGKTREELEKTGVSYAMLSGALQHAATEGGRYFDAMSKQSETLNGQWSTLKDNVDQLRGQAFSGLAERLRNDVLPAVNKFVTSMDMEKVTTTAKSLVAVVGTIGAAVGAQKVANIVGGWASMFQTAALQVSLLGMASGAAAVQEAALNGTLTVAEVLVAALTGKISMATAAQYLWNAATTAFPFGIIVAGLSAIIIACVNSSKEYKKWKEEIDSASVSADELAGHLANLKEQQAEMQAAVEEGNTSRMLQKKLEHINEEIAEAEARLSELRGTADAANEGFGNMVVPIDMVTSALEELQNYSDYTVEAVANLIQNYEELHNSITKKVKGWFNLFDEAKISVKTSVKQMMENMQSQIDFNTRYSQNLKYLADNGLSSLGEAFQNMGAEGAAYADALVSAIEEAGGATSEGGQEIINNFNALAKGVADSQTDLSTNLTDLTGTIEATLADWGVSAQQAAEGLNVSGAASAAAAASVNAYIAGIAAGAGPAGAAAASVAAAAAAGFGGGGGGGSGSGGGTRPGGRPVARLAVGSDYIPYDNFPALLHKGEMVIPAKISEDLRDFVGAGGRPTQSEQLSSGAGNGDVIALLRELIDATRRPVVLDSGALVGGIGSKMDGQLGELDDYGRRGLCMA